MRLIIIFAIMMKASQMCAFNGGNLPCCSSGKVEGDKILCEEVWGNTKVVCTEVLEEAEGNG